PQPPSLRLLPNDNDKRRKRPPGRGKEPSFIRSPEKIL
ncbi:hypothetical protein CCACVL1_00015, partial [Corchorus capsularis]